MYIADVVLSDIVIEYSKQRSPVYAQVEDRITFVEAANDITCSSISLHSFSNLLLSAFFSVYYIIN